MADGQTPIIQAQHLSKSYPMGEMELHVLRDVSLTIQPSEFVAIMGPSGSGKSTLMHILGLLDRADSGVYRLLGNEVTSFSPDELAEKRRSMIGFVFQQFNLLPRLSAVENVALPLLYSLGYLDREKATKLLTQVGLQDRLLHRPNELSGGQQQRVAIARSLVNSPKILFADEPTGNLDSKSSEEVLRILQSLHTSGMTIVLVTHEEEVAAVAERVIRMRDGEIVADSGAHISPALSAYGTPELRTPRQHRGLGIGRHITQGFRALLANKVRTFLSMLGILIGVAAVIAMVALGRGAQASIEQQLSSLGSNLLLLRPGAMRLHGVALEVGAVSRLSTDDARAIKERIPNVIDTAPSVNGRGQVSFQGNNWSTQILGTSESYQRIRNAVPPLGRFFTENEDRSRARVAVIGMTVIDKIFAGQNPIGKSIKIDKISFQVIGVLPTRGATGWRDQDDIVIIPLQTAMRRLLGRDYLDSIDIEASSGKTIEKIQEAVPILMNRRHKVPQSQKEDAFEIRNMADIQGALKSTSQTMSLLLAAIAAISLFVGGIGIMNIMLVSVTERTREIGLRKAVGAERRDILTQFLAESVVISAIGGISGILVGYAIVLTLSELVGWAASISGDSIVIALGFSASVGIIFGIYPALRAAKLDPIRALRYE